MRPARLCGNSPSPAEFHFFRPVSMAADMISAAPVSPEKILTTARLLPAAPQVMAGLCELLQDQNSDLAQVAEQIRIDAALAARVMRISNSTAYGGATRVGSVDEAVSRVGFGEILRLVGLATVAGLADRKLSFYGIAAEHLRESLLLHALAAEALGTHAGLDARIAYAGGLLRALGMMVLDRVARERAPVPERFDGRNFPTYTAWEEENFGLSSGEVTTVLLDEWRFAPQLVDAVERHLLKVEESHQDRLAVALNLAGAIVVEAGLALPGEAAAWTPTARKLAAIQLDEVQWGELRGRVLAMFAHQRSALA
jgi:HD-like signal output (HDOD) protein